MDWLVIGSVLLLAAIPFYASLWLHEERRLRRDAMRRRIEKDGTHRKTRRTVVLPAEWFKPKSTMVRLPDGTTLYESNGVIVEFFDVHVNEIGVFDARCRTHTRWIEQCQLAAGDAGGSRVRSSIDGILD